MKTFSFPKINSPDSCFKLWSSMPVPLFASCVSSHMLKSWYKDGIRHTRNYWGQKKEGRDFRPQSRSGTCGSRESRKEDWIRKFFNCSTQLRMVQPGQWGVLKPKSPLKESCNSQELSFFHMHIRLWLGAHGPGAALRKHCFIMNTMVNLEGWQLEPLGNCASCIIKTP